VHFTKMCLLQHGEYGRHVSVLFVCPAFMFEIECDTLRGGSTRLLHRVREANVEAVFQITSELPKRRMAACAKSGNLLQNIMLKCGGAHCRHKLRIATTYLRRRDETVYKLQASKVSIALLHIRLPPVSSLYACLNAT